MFALLGTLYMKAPAISAPPCGSIVAFGWTVGSGGHLLAAGDLYGRIGAGRVGSDQHAVEVVCTVNVSTLESSA